MVGTDTDPTGVALVVVDVQNDYCHPDGVFASAGLRVEEPQQLVEQINVLVHAARAAGRPVIWVRMEWPDDASVGLLAERSPFLRTQGLREGTWGSELLDGLDHEPGDPVVVKPRFSAFHQTILQDVLRQLAVGTIVVAGVRTDFCIESTVRDAFFRDLRVVVAEEAVAGYFNELHRNSLRVMGTVFAQVVQLAVAADVLAGGPLDTAPAAKAPS
ncbi:ureidoacrylate peracid hydrolase [Micromonospora coriariae]|uniref:Ureidoacrylate peracid hydrolase n=1 Tax=Micromonospora coriariae TaxID=285665 RepID=A0A1C4X4B2_9ACTN|nr:isochorismatase family cysteine hydrolase [Micromonospora coriariae]SCF03242.1 ureidoacrylate peracid hydrolase [Micromonospora coriariae]